MRVYRTDRLSFELSAGGFYSRSRASSGIHHSGGSPVGSPSPLGFAQLGPDARDVRTLTASGRRPVGRPVPRGVQVLWIRHARRIRRPALAAKNHLVASYRQPDPPYTRPIGYHSLVRCWSAINIAALAVASLVLVTHWPGGDLRDVSTASVRSLHVHTHSHGGTTHTHWHSHAHEAPGPDGTRQCCVKPDSGSDDDHHCCIACSGHGSPQPVMALTNSRTRDRQTQAAACIESAPEYPSGADSVCARWKPPPRAGPSPHISHLRTVVLLT